MYWNTLEHASPLWNTEPDDAVQALIAEEAGLATATNL